MKLCDLSRADNLRFEREALMGLRRCFADARATIYVSGKVPSGEIRATADSSLFGSIDLDAVTAHTIAPAVLGFIDSELTELERELRELGVDLSGEAAP